MHRLTMTLDRLIEWHLKESISVSLISCTYFPCACCFSEIHEELLKDLIVSIALLYQYNCNFTLSIMYHAIVAQVHCSGFYSTFMVTLLVQLKLMGSLVLDLTLAAFVTFAEDITRPSH